MYFNYVHLPQEFCTLLMSNMQTSGAGYSRLRKTLWEEPSFQAIVKISCADLGPHLSFERIINSLGWLGFRDRLASTYLHHQECGRFPDLVLLKNMEDILSFEEKIKNKTVDGYGRHFLYGFYLKMGLYYSKRLSNEKTYENYLLTKDTFEVLDTMEKRVVEIDWLCLCLHHFVEYLGKEDVLTVLNESASFQNLYGLLTNPQKYQLMKNLLSYGASIGEKSPFMFESV